MPAVHHGRALREARAIRRGRARGEVSRHLPQRRSAGARAGWVERRTFGGYNHKFYDQGLRADPAPARATTSGPPCGTTPSTKTIRSNPKTRRRVRHRHGHLAPRAHAARAEGMEAPRHRRPGTIRNECRGAATTSGTEGIERNKDYESIITIGMRGDGDMPMAGQLDATSSCSSRSSPTSARSSPSSQSRRSRRCRSSGRSTKRCRNITKRACACPTTSRCSGATTTGATSAACPPPRSASAPGGAGIYYHFDYVGGPRNYKWINTNPIPKIWEQMNLALQYGADRIWIVNVGDLKPMEFPIEFFLNLARDPERWPKDKHRRIHAPVGRARIRRRSTPPKSPTSSPSTRSTTAAASPNCSIPTPSASSTTTRPTASSADFEAIVDAAEAICTQRLPRATPRRLLRAGAPSRQGLRAGERSSTSPPASNQLYAAQGRATANDAGRTREGALPGRCRPHRLLQPHPRSTASGTT